MTVNELIRKARELKLENVEILDRYSVEEISVIYNGIGPDRFPEVLREFLNTLHPTLQVVALIHDIEYHEGGTREQFTESNDRFCRNGKTAAFDAYSWYDPRRYLVWNKARQFRNLCELFGWSGWTLTPPPDAGKYTFVDGQWVEQSVEELRAQLGETLWSNYKTYQRTYVDPEDLTLANTCAAGGSEKGAAVQQWVLALWARYYEVKDLLAAAETLEALREVDISTAELTPPPYTIRELNEEAAAFLAHGE